VCTGINKRLATVEVLVYILEIEFKRQKGIKMSIFLKTIIANLVKMLLGWKMIKFILERLAITKGQLNGTP
jgi:hypothetical protein